MSLRPAMSVGGGHAEGGDRLSMALAGLGSGLPRTLSRGPQRAPRVPREPTLGPDWEAAIEEARHFQEGDLEGRARRYRSSRMLHRHYVGIGCLWAVFPWQGVW